MASEESMRLAQQLCEVSPGARRLKAAELVDAVLSVRDKRIMELTAERDALRELLIDVYDNVGNHSSRRHALPPGLRDTIRDTIDYKAICAARTTKGTDDERTRD